MKLTDWKPPENVCKNCQYGKPLGQGCRQVICQKTNKFEPELYSCDWFKHKENK